MNGAQPGQRVLLVEDDPSLQRFVTLALEDLELQLRVCGTVAEALEALRQQPADLLITDLMLPDRSGLDLLAQLQAEPALAAGARRVVFSAGLRPQQRERLEALGVWRLLLKPCSLPALQDCVRQGLAAPAAAGESAAAEPAPVDEQAAAIAEHFAGNAALFTAFRNASLAQFAADLAAGEQACEGQDGPALRRLAHNLKSVLGLLGQPGPGELAGQLERLLEARAAEPGLPDQAAALWQRLREQLQRLRQAAPPAT